MEVKGIVTIGLEHIHPHPDNPRKDLGDLTELAESIKKNGIMQNLTVIPKEGEPGEYITIIGHRRSAAAKLAGVTEAPCRVVEGMTDKEQMSTMLEENMQRNDLTIWEQAQGFQMMDWETFTGHNKLIEFFVGCEVYNAPEEEKEAARKKMQGLSVLQKLLCLVSAMVADADLVEWNYTYNTVKGEKVKAFYGILEQYGFQFPNDEEKGVVEGTSDLYVKKEGAK